jgi:hypothetical protein
MPGQEPISPASMTLFPRESREPESVAVAAGPARWLLEMASQEGVPLTQTHALARALVREATERWPDWWDTDRFGPAYREAELAPLALLHEGLRRLRLVRRRGGRMLTTNRGKALAKDETALLRVLAADLGGGDPFGETMACLVVKTLALDGESIHDQLSEVAWQTVARGGWHDGHGNQPARVDVATVVSDVLWRGIGYGLIARTFPRGGRGAHPYRYT